MSPRSPPPLKELLLRPTVRFTVPPVLQPAQEPKRSEIEMSPPRHLCSKGATTQYAVRTYFCNTSRLQLQTLRHKGSKGLK